MKFIRNKILYLTTLSAVLLIVTACSFNPFAKPSEPADSWKTEILWGQDCGLDRMSCCPEEPACTHGQACCVDPNDASRNYCADECGCGQEGEFCCADEPKCSGGLACFRGFCAPCGDKDQPCCADMTACSGELLCYRELCVECGQPGNPCCNGEAACSGQGDTDGGRTECYDDICVYCGYRGHIACPGAVPCNPGHLLNNDFCYECGAYNQPCCDEDAGTGYICDPEDGLVCHLGFCTKG